MRQVRLRASCARTGHVLLSPLRRVRDVSRSKPRAKAVGGSRKSAGEVDGSETGSANEAAPSGAASFFGQSALHLANGNTAGAPLARVPFAAAGAHSAI